MKLATILPTKFLSYTKEDDYHMALAHLVGKDAEYTEFYKKVAADGAYVILDNGVIEGDQQDIATICERAKSIGASEIILPDVFKNMGETLDASFEALQFVRKFYPELKIMAVPQGLTVAEWVECAEEMLTWEIDAIGVPKVLVHLDGRDARLHAIASITKTLKVLRAKGKEVAVHLLGCWTTPLELTIIEMAARSGTIYPVRGCDSSLPYVYTIKGLKIDEDDRPNMAMDFEHLDIDEELLAENIKLWKKSVTVKKDKVINIF
jgi:hypothetical protein